MFSTIWRVQNRSRMDASDPFEVHPSMFVGKAGDCGPAPGSHIVTSAWLHGMGLPDNGGLNNASNAQDLRSGLLLSKNGLTSDCSAALAKITGVAGITLTELGFDIRTGTHCGAGAPRFNVVASDGSVTHFFGCAAGTKSPAPQDPTAWTRVRLSPADPTQAFPIIAPGAKVKSIEIVFDEGTDAGPGAGLAVIDNIDINGTLVVGKAAGGGSEEGGEGQD